MYIFHVTAKFAFPFLSRPYVFPTTTALKQARGMQKVVKILIEFDYHVRVNLTLIAPNGFEGQSIRVWITEQSFCY